MTRALPKPPKGLCVAGTALWRAIHGGLPATMELDERETAVLGLACRQADDVAALEAVLARDGVVVEGSSGQPRLSGVVSELRQARLATAKLLGELQLPDAAEQPASASSKRAQKAAHARWAEHNARKQARHG
ncbi:MAG: P27 family phage terminase small subunit [Solirubrobacteraceae bacterium]